MAAHPIVLHQDHGANPAVCQASIRSGFTSVMIDGSLREDMKTPALYAYLKGRSDGAIQAGHLEPLQGKLQASDSR